LQEHLRASAVAASAVNSQISSINARIAELESALSTLGSHETIVNSLPQEVRNLSAGQAEYDAQYNRKKATADAWRDEIAGEKQKLEDAKN